MKPVNTTTTARFVVSMESGLEDRNNVIVTGLAAVFWFLSQWSPA